MSRKRGIVKWFHRLKGYGFIEPEGNEVDMYVHYTIINGEGYRNLSEDNNNAAFEDNDLSRDSQSPRV